MQAIAQSPYKTVTRQISTPVKISGDFQREFDLDLNSSGIIDFITHDKFQKKKIPELYTTADAVNIDNVTSDNKAESALGRVATAMPSWVILYSQEVKEKHTQNVILKFISALVSTLIFTILGIHLSYILLGVVVFAFGDAILGLFPHNIMPGTEKDHKLQAKAGAFFTNFFGIIVVYKGMELISKGTLWVNIVITTLIVFWVAYIYVFSIVKYIAKANNTKAPTWIVNYFDRTGKKLAD